MNEIVREKVSPMQNPIGRRLELPGRFDRGMLPFRPGGKNLGRSGKERMDMGFGHLGTPCEIANPNTSKGKFPSERIHQTQYVNAELIVQGGHSPFSICLLAHNGPMRRWPQQENLKKAVKAFQKEHGWTQVQVADALGTTVDVLRQWLNNKNSKPSFETLQKFSALLGISILEFVDDPAKKLIGQPLSNLTEEGRYLASVIVKDLASEELTDEDRRFLAEEFSRSKDRLRAFRATKASDRG